MSINYCHFLEGNKMKTANDEKISILREAGLLDKLLSKWRCEMANRLIPDEARSGKILDIGCGTYPLFLMNTEFTYKFGLDQVVTEDSHKRWESDKVKFKKLNAEETQDIPFEDDYFDVVTMLAVFEHIDPPKLVKLLSEIRRVLKKDGIFVMTTPAGWTDSVLTVMAKFRLVSPLEFAEHKDAYTPAKITAIYDQAGFERAKTRLGYFECFMNIWVAAKK